MSTAQAMDIQQELNVAIAETRGGYKSGKLAWTAIQKDHQGTMLIGVRPDGAIIRWETANWSLSKLDVPPDEGSSFGLCVNGIEKFRRFYEVERWVAAEIDTFHWLHPRFRWLEEVERRYVTCPDAEPV